MIGADPEMLLVNKDGKYISGVGIVGGSKDVPLQVNKGALQEDNVMAEININPASSCNEFIDNITTVIDELRSRLPKDLSVALVSFGDFSDDQLQVTAANEFGCMADFNVWKQEQNPPILLKGNRRYCGGHVHLSDEKFHNFLLQARLPKLCDLFLGVPSVLLDKSGGDRHLYYGKAGNFRWKKYPGIEYRTLSNFWLGSKAHMEWVWEAANRAISNSENEKLVAAIDEDEEAIVHCINSKDQSIAAQLIDKYELL